MYSDMTPYRVVIQRGGTSKGIFIKENELPKNIEERNKVIRGIFGTPDKREIDGLGGADVLTSKLAIVGPSTREDADVDYTFAQVSFDTNLVDYGGNCGNISAGVGPFAIDEGMINITEPITRVRIHQVNTDCILVADVPVKGGKALYSGNCKIAGVPGTGGEIMLDFSDTVGTTTGKLLPTGNPMDTVTVEGYGDYNVSIVDAGNVVIFIDAESLDIEGTESCSEMESNRSLMNKIEAIRATCTVKLGMANSVKEATEKSAYVPFFAVVSKKRDYIVENTGEKIEANEIDIVSRLSFMLHMHKTYPGTGTVCTGAAARIEGTIVNKLLDQEAKKDGILKIGHPGGIIEIDAKKGSSTGEKFDRLAYSRTSRRILDGICYVKNDRL